VGRSPVKGALPNCIKGLIITECNCESEQVRGPNPRKPKENNFFKQITVARSCSPIALVYQILWALYFERFELILCVRRMKYAGRLTRMGEINAYKILAGKSERKKRPLGRTRSIWEDNIKMVLRKIGCEGVNRMHLAQDTDQWRAVVNTVMNFRVPKKAGIILTS